MTGSSKQTTTPAWEFFDLEKDPGENRNAYSDPIYKEVIAEMKLELQKLREEYEDTDEGYEQMQTIFETYWD